MAPRWALAIFLMISILLGIGQATLQVCGEDKSTICVEAKYCAKSPVATYRRTNPCPFGQLCCDVELSNTLSTYEPDY